MVRVRLAPSPTGKLHVGNIRTALANILFARAQGGKFVVRMEDTDLSREVENAESQILADLAWLGMSADEDPAQGGDYAPYRTSERDERGDYKKAIEKLTADGRIYACYVSKTELDLMRKIQTSQGQPPHYDNRHRDLSDTEKQTFIDEGREPVLRFKLEEGTVAWDDMVRGKVSFEAKNLGGDPVVVRSNGVPIFALAGAVDDISQEITHVVRGEDHVTNTAIQIQIFEALGAKAPTMAHMPLLLDTDGGKLSKRLDGLSVESLRDAGYLPQAILTYMASLGFSATPEIGSVDDLAPHYDFSKMGRSSVRFDTEQLDRINAQLLHNSDWAEIKEYAQGFLKTDKTETEVESFWQAVRGNIMKLDELQDAYNTCYGTIDVISIGDEDKSYLAIAAETLPTGVYTEETWNQWVNILKTESGRKGRALFMPLRLALTGRSHGPEMAHLLPVLGEELARTRLHQAVQ